MKIKHIVIVSFIFALMNPLMLFGKTISKAEKRKIEHKYELLSKKNHRCYTYKMERYCKGYKQTSVHHLLDDSKKSPDGFGFIKLNERKTAKPNSVVAIYRKKIQPYQDKNKIDSDVLMYSKISLRAADYAITRVSDVKRRGKTSLRFEIRNGDCNTGVNGQLNDCKTNRERAEVTNLWLAPMDVPVYYAYSIFLPKDYAEMDNPYQIIGQFHDNQSNNFSNEYQDGKLFINVKYNHRDRLHAYVTNFTKGKWHDFVYKMIWSTDKEKGLSEVSMDGKKLFSYRGRTLSDGAQVGPYFKMGIYRSHLERYKHGKHPTQILYYDEYRHGKTLKSVSYKDNPPLD